MHTWAAVQETSSSPWRNLASLVIQNAPSEDSDQTARMRSLIWIFAGRTCPKLCLQTFRLIYLFICLFISNPLQAHLPVALKNGFYFLFNVYPLYPTPYNGEGTLFRQKLEAICFSEDSKYLLCARNLLLRELSLLKKKKKKNKTKKKTSFWNELHVLIWILDNQWYRLHLQLRQPQ